MTTSEEGPNTFLLNAAHHRTGKGLANEWNRIVVRHCCRKTGEWGRRIGGGLDRQTIVDMNTM